MPYVNVPGDLSKIKTKLAFNLTKRQLICFGGGLPLEKVVRNILRTKYLRPGARPYQTQNIYKQFAETEVQNIAESPKIKSKARRRKGR